MNSSPFLKVVRNLAVCTSMFSAVSPLAAQAVIAPPPAVYSAEAATDAQSKNPPGKRLSNIASALGAGAPLIQRGVVALRPHFLYRLVYADRLLNPGQDESGNSIIQTASFIQTASLGTLVELGKHWSLDYTLTKSYSSNRFVSGSTDHAVSLAGGIAYGDLRIGLSQSYITNSPILVETAAQTKQEVYSTGIDASYFVGSKTTVGLAIAHSTRLANSPVLTPEWVASDWRSINANGSIGYFLSPRLKASLIISAGRDRVSRGSDMSHTQPQVQLNWRPTPKLSVSANAGVEQRRFISGSKESISTPLYSVSGHFQPTLTTRFSVGASRSITASYFANQASENTALSFGYEQRLLGSYFWTTDISQFETKYIATSAGFSTGRTDRGSIVSTRVATVILGKVSLSVFYQVGHNSSSRVGFGLNSHQVGGELGYRF